ncbi:hypothetical protein BD408DRAFT_486790 [Parasitella parasitica]|nr:hypothetical protein BD408DRAFT_486790 [Parasitella parasitica]
MESSSNSPYKLNNVYDKEILGVVWTFTKKFDKTTSLALTQWLNKQNVDFLSDEPERKVVKGNTKNKKLRRRHLNVLDNGCYVDLAKNIINVIPKHHAYVNQLKNDGYHIIGYYRKSRTPSDNRAALLQRMVDIIRQRSLVEKVYVSTHSNAKEGFHKRDLDDQNTLIAELDQVDGGTQDFLAYIHYAGFTTNMSDLKIIISEYPNMQKMIIDLYFYENQF